MRNIKPGEGFTDYLSPPALSPPATVSPTPDTFPPSPLVQLVTKSCPSCHQLSLKSGHKSPRLYRHRSGPGLPGSLAGWFAWTTAMASGHLSPRPGLSGRSSPGDLCGAQSHSRLWLAQNPFETFSRLQGKAPNPPRRPRVTFPWWHATSPALASDGTYTHISFSTLTFTSCLLCIHGDHRKPSSAKTRCHQKERRAL